MKSEKPEKLHSDPPPMDVKQKTKDDPMSTLAELDKILDEQGMDAAIKWADNWLNS